MKLNEKVVIYGTRVILVPYEREHVEKYHNWMKDREILEATASEPLSIEKEYEMQESWRRDEDKLTFILLSAAKIEAGSTEVEAMIGDVNLFLNDPEDDQAGEIEVMIAEKDARQKGCATEAVKLMMGYCYDKLHISRFIAKIGKHNLKSYSLFKNKLKFRFESESEIFEEFTMELFMDEKGRRVINVPFQELKRNPKWNEEKEKPYYPPEPEKLQDTNADIESEESKVSEDPDKMFLCVKYGDEEDDKLAEDGYADDSEPAKPKKPKLQYGGIRVIEKETTSKKNDVFDDEFDEVW